MWIFTTEGFYSIVQDRIHQDRLWIRTRRREDLERLLNKLREQYRPEIQETPDADYPYRAMLTKTIFSTMLAQLVKQIDYDNFKAEIEDKERHDAYLSIWAVLRSRIDPRPKGERNQMSLFMTAPGPLEESLFPDEARLDSDEIPF